MTGGASGCGAGGSGVGAPGAGIAGAGRVGARRRAGGDARRPRTRRRPGRAHRRGRRVARRGPPVAWCCGSRAALPFRAASRLARRAPAYGCSLARRRRTERTPRAIALGTAHRACEVAHRGTTGSAEATANVRRRVAEAPSQTLKRTPLYDRHVAASARMVPFAGWEMPVQYGGIREEHVAVRTAAGVFDVSHMGQIECSRPAGGRPAAAADLERCRLPARRGLGLCGPVPRGRRHPRRPPDVPPRAGALPHRHERVEPREGPRLVRQARRGLRRRGRRRDRPLRDARRPGPAGARVAPGDRRRAAAGPPHRLAADAVRPPGARVRHRLHRRGRGRGAAARRRTPPRCGTRSSAAASPPPASARATRCASRRACRSTATTCPRSAARSRAASAGAARRTRASSAPTPSAPSARPGPPSACARSASPGAASRGRATRSRAAAW